MTPRSLRRRRRLARRLGLDRYRLTIEHGGGAKRTTPRVLASVTLAEAVEIIEAEGTTEDTYTGRLVFRWERDD